jgi:gas vesicle protein
VKHNGAFIKGIALGSAIGAAIGVLFAPAPGYETREKVAEKGKDVGNMAVERAKEKTGMVKEVTKEFIEELKHKLPDSIEIRQALETLEREVDKQEPAEEIEKKFERDLA